MIDLQKLQKEVYQNKLDKGFNVTNIEMEFNYIFGELVETIEAYRDKKDDLGEEIADVVIYMLGLAEILKIDLETELISKFEKIKKRQYKTVNGVLTRVKN